MRTSFRHYAAIVMGILFCNHKQGFETSAFHLPHSTVTPSSSVYGPSLFASARQEKILESSNRRTFGAGLLAIVPASIMMCQPKAHAKDDTNGTNGDELLRVTITRGANSETDFMDPSFSALYITARPNTVDNVPRAILDGSRGKPPPVLIARIPGVVALPFQVALTSKDVTAEGNATEESVGSFWWKDSGLIVSARLDMDGIAATRDPNDLVGRSSVEAGKESVVVELQGRGATGKFFTKKDKK